MKFLYPSAVIRRRASEKGTHSEAFQSWRWVLLAAILLAVVTIGTFYFSSAQAQDDRGTITGLTLTSDTPGTLTVSWDTASPAPTDYRVDWAKSTEEYQSWTVDKGHVYPAETATTVTITDLAHDIEYKIRMRARYYKGEHEDEPWGGPWAEVSLEVAGEPAETPTPEPEQEEESTTEAGAIDTLAATDDDTGQLVLTWEAPAVPNATPTDYHVNWAKSTEDYPSDTDENGNDHPTTTTYTLAGLEFDTDYNVRARARYTDGANANSPWNGPWTETTAQVKQPLPAAPHILGTALSPDGDVMLVWQNPSDDSITGYQILRGPDADSLAVIVEDTGSGATTYTDTSPPAGQTHTYAVKTRNSSGLSPLSNTLTATVPAAEEEPVIAAQHETAVPSAVAVGNIGSLHPAKVTARGNFEGMQFATAFTTGSLAQGYNLTGVGLKVSADAGVTPRVSIYSDRGIAAPNDKPGRTNVVQVLANPDDLDQDLNTIEFFAATPVTLTANTKYWVVLEHNGGTGYVRASTASSLDPDDGSLSGWSIGTTRFRHNATYDWQNYPINMAIEVRAGELVGYTLESVAVTSKPLDGDTYKAGENLELLFTFNTPVKYVRGVAALSFDGAWRGAHYVNGSGTNQLRYQYRVKSGDSDADGFALNGNPLSMTADATVLTFSGSPVTVEHPLEEAGSDHKVNGGEKGCVYVFCTDVEVAELGTDVHGAVYYSESSVNGGLSNRLFRYGSANYQVRQLLVRGSPGRLELLLDREPEADLLAEGSLHVGTRFFHFNAATLHSDHRLTWPNSGLTWNADDHVRVSLQDNILVSNFTSGNGISDAAISTSARAQAFTTGPRENGYRITEVRLKAGAPTNTTPRLAIHSDSSGVPGTKLLELTNPTAMAATAEEASFTSLGLLLAANTTYWAFVDRASGSGDVLASVSASNGENDGSATGWSIADSSYQSNGASWTEQTGEILQITIEGRESAGSSSAPEFPDNDGNGAADPITFTVAENATVDTRVGVVGATDSDHDPLTHSLGGTDATDFNQVFALDTSTGAITVKSALDYDVKSSYSVVIRVADGRNASGDTETTATIDDTVRVTIYVRKVSEPVTISPIADLSDKVLLSNYAITLGGGERPTQISIQSSGLAVRRLGPSNYQQLDRYIRVGMPFTTGPTADGYALGIVRLPMHNRGYEFDYSGGWAYSDPYHPDFGKDRNIPQVSIWSNSSAGNPAARLHTLVSSRDLSQRDNDFYSDGFTLMPGTTYWVVVETLNVHHRNSFPVVMDGLFYRIGFANPDDVPDHDDTTEEGWSIGDSVKKYYSGRQVWCIKASSSGLACSEGLGDSRMKMALFEPLGASAPFFRNADGNGKADPMFFLVPEDTASGASVGKVVVHNFDDDVLTFAVSGDSSVFDSKFLLDRQTGEITLNPNRTLNYETQRQTYVFDVTVHDGEDGEGDSEPVPTIDDVTTVTIEVTNVNDPGVLSLTTDEPRVDERMVATLIDEDGGLIHSHWVWSCGAQELFIETNNNGLGNGPGKTQSEYTPQSEDAGKQCNVGVVYGDAANQSEWLSLPFRPRAE